MIMSEELVHDTALQEGLDALCAIHFARLLAEGHSPHDVRTMILADLMMTAARIAIRGGIEREKLCDAVNLTFEIVKKYMQ